MTLLTTNSRQFVAVLAFLVVLASRNLALATPIFDFYSNRNAFVSTNSEIAHITFNEPFQNPIYDKRGQKYYRSFSIGDVNFRPWKSNSNIPGIRALNDMGSRFWRELYSYPGSGNTITALESAIEVDFSGVSDDVTMFGVNWGNYGKPVPCCIEQNIAIKLKSGETISIRPKRKDFLGRDASVKLSVPDFLGVTLQDDSIESVRFHQVGNGGVLANLFYGSAIQQVPEPSTTTLLLGAVGGLLGLRRRRAA